MSLFSNLFHSKRNQKSVWEMSREELLSLEDEDFYFAMAHLNFDKVLYLSDCRNRTHRTYYILMSFIRETYNGGISQFFYNSSRECAPYVSDALREIGSIKTKNAYDELLKTANIPLQDMDALQALDEDEAAVDAMDAFDEQFYENEDVSDCLLAYCRTYIDDLMV